MISASTDVLGIRAGSAFMDEVAAFVMNNRGDINVSVIGKSTMGNKPIYMFEKGTINKKGNKRDKRIILYVGAHHGSEWITANLLVRLMLEPDFNGSGGFTPVFVPLLNPDGADIALLGTGALSGKSREEAARLIARNNQSTDFTCWQANGRGVDLNHNYNYRFDEYKLFEKKFGITSGRTKYSGAFAESENESRALAVYIRSVMPGVILSLHTQGEEIYWKSGGSPSPYDFRGAFALSQLCGYRLSSASGSAAYGGLCDYTRGLGIPSYTLECGRGRNPLPLSDAGEIYKRIAPGLKGIGAVMER